MKIDMITYFTKLQFNQKILQEVTCRKVLKMYIRILFW